MTILLYTNISNIKTGEWIRQNAGMKKLILELSGNDAAIICADCDMKQTVNGVVSGAFLHSGEVCDRIKRAYVVDDIAEEFINKVVKRAKEITITTLIRQENREIVHEQVNQSIKDGAQLLTGGTLLKGVGYYYLATILKLKTNKEQSAKNEVFGPVLSIMTVKDEDEAISKANDSIYGLGASIWTQDYAKGLRLSRELEAGIVWVNDSNIPLVCGEHFAGWKNTAIPTSEDRLSMFTKKQTIISYNSNKEREWWYK